MTAKKTEDRESKIAEYLKKAEELKKEGLIEEIEVLLVDSSFKTLEYIKEILDGTKSIPKENDKPIKPNKPANKQNKAKNDTPDIVPLEDLEAFLVGKGPVSTETINNHFGFSEDKKKKDALKKILVDNNEKFKKEGDGRGTKWFLI